MVLSDLNDGWYGKGQAMTTALLGRDRVKHMPSDSPRCSVFAIDSAATQIGKLNPEQRQELFDCLHKIEDGHPEACLRPLRPQVNPSGDMFLVNSDTMRVIVMKKNEQIPAYYLVKVQPATAASIVDDDF